MYNWFNRIQWIPNIRLKDTFGDNINLVGLYRENNFWGLDLCPL